MQFEKLEVFKSRPTRRAVPKEFHKLVPSTRQRLIGEITSFTAKKEVSRWLVLDNWWAFGPLKPQHPELFAANAVISATIDMWPGRNYWDIATYFAQADDWEVATVHAVARYLDADAETEANRIATAFSFPPELDAIRERLTALQPPWKAFERSANAFIQASEAHQRGPDSRHPILETLQAMNLPDVELWHEIVTSNAPLSGARMRAMDWILAQPNCDRATAAAFLGTAVEYSTWEVIRASGKEAFQDFLEVIVRWNSGFYEHCNLSPEDGAFGVVVDIAGLPALYENFWAKSFPGKALPVPQAKPLDKPNRRALRLYTKPSGFAYSTLNDEALIFVKGRPQKKSYF